ncbi:MAG TPA: biotin/lipoyl-containing protein, partial [Pedobacter sp.]|nr:biotin/lipoyl-containing protein [Pedobacter sp.]
MAQYELLLPKMGESVAEATIIKWNKQPGDMIQLDDTVLEIATDKVDSEVPSPVAGKLVKQLFKIDDVVQVGTVIAIIETDSVGSSESSADSLEPRGDSAQLVADSVQLAVESSHVPGVELLAQPVIENQNFKSSDRFYSPLVKSIATQENISTAELDQIKGTGAEGRLTKDDLLSYIQSKNGGTSTKVTQIVMDAPSPIEETARPTTNNEQRTTSVSGSDEIIEMD